MHIQFESRRKGVLLLFDFYRVSDANTVNLMYACSHGFSEMTMSALIGAGALNRANAVLYILHLAICL